MKWKISMVIVMLLLTRIPVFIVSDGADIILLKIPFINLKIETTQLHSVSLTPVKDSYVVTPYNISQHTVIYSDQGGAGMPNHNEIILDDVFYSSFSNDSKRINLLMDDNNKLVVSNESIVYQDSKTHVMQMKISRLFLFEYLYKVGSL